MEDGSMEISLSKTKGMHVRPRMDLGAPAEADYDRVEMKHRCRFCDRGFPNVKGCGTHEALHCPRRFGDDLASANWEVERLIDVRGPPDARFFKVYWKGVWPADQQTQWTSESEIDCQRLVDAFWTDTGRDRTQTVEVDGEYRCEHCCWITKAGTGYLKAHQKKSADKGGCKRKPVGRTGSLTEKIAKRTMQEEAQGTLEHVEIDGDVLENVFRFDYLGVKIQGDGDRVQMVEQRMTLAKAIFGSLWHFWNSHAVSESLKMRIYAAGVISILTYGCESWILDGRMTERLRNWSARCLSQITGRTVPDEHRSPTWDLVPRLISRRAKWLGHVLRAQESHPVRRVLKGWVEQVQSGSGSYREGSVLAEAPAHDSFAQLTDLADDRETWRHWTVARE